MVMLAAVLAILYKQPLHELFMISCPTLKPALYRTHRVGVGSSLVPRLPWSLTWLQKLWLAKQQSDRAPVLGRAHACPPGWLFQLFRNDLLSTEWKA